jgi:Ca2+:H+ antiporter
MNRLRPPSEASTAENRKGSSTIRVTLLLLVPVAPVAAYGFNLTPIWIFLAGIAGIAILAEWIRVATEQLALHVGPTVGGLLTVSLGSLAELMLALFVLASGKIDVVRAQITGSIMGTCLFGLGLAIIVGGFSREHQSFNRKRAGLMSSMLILVVIALLLPAVFDYTSRSVGHAASVDVTDEALSLAVSGVLLLLYAGNLVYTLVTHRDVFTSGETRGDKPRWSVAICLLVLAAATAGAALESELVAGALTDTARTLGLTPLFMGVVVLALVGTGADIFAAVWFARRDRMGLVMSICIGSGIQVALVVAPLLVIFSWLLGNPMTLVFSNPIELFSIASTAFIVNAIAGDGETTWFKGMLLLGVYVVFGMAYFLA